MCTRRRLCRTQRANQTRKKARPKYLTYESGVDPVGTGWTQSNIRYYIFALLFVMFDVEAVFIFPWATRLEQYGLFGLVEMAIFIFILLLGTPICLAKRSTQMVLKNLTKRIRHGIS